MVHMSSVPPALFVERQHHNGGRRWTVRGQSQQIMSALPISSLLPALVTKPILLMKVDFELACQPVCLLNIQVF